jgi:hypothetical protein
MVARWNKDTGKYKEIPLPPFTFEEGKEKHTALAAPQFLGGKVWVFHKSANEIYVIDPQTEEITEADTGLPYRLGEQKNIFYVSPRSISFFSERDENSIVLRSHYDNSLLHLDARTGTFTKKKIITNGIEHLKRNPALLEPYQYKENVYSTINDYIGKICSGAIPPFIPELAEYHRAINANSDGTCGEKIHDYIMKKH